MKFTHRLFTTKGWAETNYSLSDYEEVKHLGECPEDGDVFVAYDSTGHMHIFKGVLKEELKTDTWYKNKHTSLLVYRTGNEENYGIEEFIDSDTYGCFTPENWQEATEEEVKEALVKVAKKKGFKGINELRLKLINGEVFEKGYFIFGENKFRFENNKLSLDGVEIFHKGKWAEILEEEEPLTILAIEERLKRLEEKVNGNNQ